MKHLHPGTDEGASPSRIRWAAIGASALAGAALTAWLAVPHFRHEPPALFEPYESVRQALLGQSLADVRARSSALAGAAAESSQTDVAARAAQVARAESIASARDAFAALSDAMIVYRREVKATAPAIAYCPMAKRSWLQPRGAIGNPYYDASMSACGEFKPN